MISEDVCITIPEELLQFRIEQLEPKEKDEEKAESNFGVKVIRNLANEIEQVNYYTDTGDLIKSVHYTGFAISSIKYFRNSYLYAEERYSDEKLVSKGLFDKNGNIIKGVAFKYNRQCKITSIEKSINEKRYLVEYGYDELERVNSRKITINGLPAFEQKYRFDILDRIVEYYDNNQTIKVSKISPKNELLYYTITDKIGNEISITNYFSFGKYIESEVLLNGHRTTVKNQSYVDNIMLKKPYTTEDDLDLIIANLFSYTESKTARITMSDISQERINENITARVLPISIRKRALYNTVVNL